jgi:hypothetical protein
MAFKVGDLVNADNIAELPEGHWNVIEPSVGAGDVVHVESATMEGTMLQRKRAKMITAMRDMGVPPGRVTRAEEDLVGVEWGEDGSLFVTRIEARR